MNVRQLLEELGFVEPDHDDNVRNALLELHYRLDKVGELREPINLAMLQRYHRQLDDRRQS